MLSGINLTPGEAGDWGQPHRQSTISSWLSPRKSSGLRHWGGSLNQQCHSMALQSTAPLWCHMPHSSTGGQSQMGEDHRGPTFAGPFPLLASTTQTITVKSNGFVELCEFLLNLKVVLGSPQTCQLVSKMKQPQRPLVCSLVLFPSRITYSKSS